MALTTAGIEQARNEIARMKEGSIRLKELENVLKTLQNDENFAQFRNGTYIGAETYEKIQTIMRLISTQLYDVIITFVNATTTYLNKQEEYNNRNTGSGSINNGGSIATPTPVPIQGVGKNQGIVTTTQQ